jgi:hypothetical protein
MEKALANPFLYSYRRSAEMLSCVVFNELLGSDVYSKGVAQR